MTKEIKYLPKPWHSFIQWHITERCNLRCKHCYQTSYNTPELEFEKIVDIINQYVELLNSWRIKGRVQITGGEPFLRNDLFKILEELHKNRDSIPSFGIMSNGLFVTKDIAKRLKELNLGFFQVSLEGMQKTNDSIRGIGTFQKIINAAKILVEEGIRTSISMTSNKLNYKEYLKLVEVGEKIGVNTVWSDRLVPCGQGLEIKNQMLEPFEVKEFYEKIINKKRELWVKKSKTQVSTGRPLYLLAGGDKGHTCDVVGTRGLTILPNGDVYPCRRLPVKVGNLTEQSMFEIWYGNDFLWQLRDRNNYRQPLVCRKCEFFEGCAGGSKCVAFGYFGTPFAVDPQCWKAFDKLPNPKEFLSLKTSEKKPEYWDNIIVQKTKLELGDYLEENNGKIYLWQKLKKIELVKEKGIISKKGKNILLKINFSNFNQNKLIKNITKSKPKKLLISPNINSESINLKTKSKILSFLEKLEENKINFILTKPLPKCLIGINYTFTSRKVNAPLTLREGLELFIVKNNHIFLPVLEKKGPQLNYMRDRDQIYEFYCYLQQQIKTSKSNEKCIFFKKKQCDGCNIFVDGL